VIAILGNSGIDADGVAETEADHYRQVAGRYSERRP
jgi:hypothetical protein